MIIWNKKMKCQSKKPKKKTQKKIVVNFSFSPNLSKFYEYKIYAYSFTSFFRNACSSNRSKAVSKMWQNLPFSAHIENSFGRQAHNLSRLSMRIMWHRCKIEKLIALAHVQTASRNLNQGSTSSANAQSIRSGTSFTIVGKSWCENFTSRTQSQGFTNRHKTIGHEVGYEIGRWQRYRRSRRFDNVSWWQIWWQPYGHVSKSWVFRCFNDWALNNSFF